MVLAAYTAGFNLLLWLGLATLGSNLSARLGEPGAWSASAAAPLCLLALASRLRPEARPALLTIAAVSLAAAAATA